MTAPYDKALAAVAAFSDQQFDTYLVATVGLFAAVAAGRQRHDIEKACCNFIQEMHEITGGRTPLPPTPKGR